jgi:hypothetical protein
MEPLRKKEEIQNVVNESSESRKIVFFYKDGTFKVLRQTNQPFFLIKVGFF